MPMSPLQFEAVIRMRGYTLSEVATRWGLSPARLTQIKSDVLRSARYEDAVWGLPDRKLAAAILARRERIVQDLAAGIPLRSKKSKPLRTLVAPPLPLIEEGDVWAVKDSQGDHLPEGCEGWVTSIGGRGPGAKITLRFVNGYTETFDQQYLNDASCFLAATGKIHSSD